MPGLEPAPDEHRKGPFVCAGCDLPLFTSDTKFESGTGWPSFYAAIPGAVAKKTDLKIGVPRTEYHCVRCAATRATSSTTARSRPASATATTASRSSSS